MWKTAGLLFTLLGWSHYLQAQNLPNMNRIVGGHIARIEDYPYMVHVLHNNRCSGAIINNNTVLTAAHCIFRRSIDGTVIAGETLFHKNTYPKGHLFKTVWAKMHPDYDDITKANDIAIVRIDGFFEYSDKIKPIELLDDEVPAGEFCAISGWGKTTLARPKKGPKPSVAGNLRKQLERFLLVHVS
ncbi:chymotrypsin-1-like isoform X2 [Atheta coriaria]|uniref:chymotrypsin-1-like isoform X2 n=1 Tax=Dalotia coriaria TaxID=877792 RepID=UPI0031F4601B